MVEDRNLGTEGQGRGSPVDQLLDNVRASTSDCGLALLDGAGVDGRDDIKVQELPGNHLSPKYLVRVNPRQFFTLHTFFP